MGRPIKKIFIGERAGFEGGGEGVASVTVVTGSSSGFVDAEAALITAPDLPGGVQAEGFVESAAGALDSVVITEAGSGYTSPPTVTFTTGTIGTGTATAVLTTGGVQTINATAYLLTTNEAADIIAQKGDVTYRVETATDGIGEASLINDTPTAVGEMAIIATDSASGTYYVTKLYNNTVRLDPTNGTGVQFGLGDKVEWAKDGVAVVKYSVDITS